MVIFTQFKWGNKLQRINLIIYPFFYPKFFLQIFFWESYFTESSILHVTSEKVVPTLFTILITSSFNFETLQNNFIRPMFVRSLDEKCPNKYIHALGKISET